MMVPRLVLAADGGHEVSGDAVAVEVGDVGVDPRQRAEGAGMAGREAGDEAAAGDRADVGVMNEPDERTDAAPARPKLLLLPPK